MKKKYYCILFNCDLILLVYTNIIYYYTKTELYLSFIY